VGDVSRSARRGGKGGARRWAISSSLARFVGRVGIMSSLANEHSLLTLRR
jgi:hypothetical protein